jgi:Glycosyl transferase family 2
MLDAIITVSSNTPAAWVAQARRTVREAADAAEYSVNVIEVPGVPGHIGRAMLAGIMAGTNPWICWIDDDDYVLPNAFDCLQKHMDKPVDAICAREVHVLANGRLRNIQHRHHLTAFRRSAILGVDLREFPSMPNVALHRATPNVAHERSWVYMRRIRRSPAMYLRAKVGAIERGKLNGNSDSA